MAKRTTKSTNNGSALTFQESIEYMMKPLEFLENNRERFRRVLEKKYGKGVDLVEYELKNIEEEARKRGGMEREKVVEIVESSIKAAYKRMFGTDENCFVKIQDDFSRFDVYMKQIVVADDDHADALLEIPLSEAKDLDPNSEVGDEILKPIDPAEFNRIAMMNGKQRCRQETRDFTRNSIFSTWKTKEHKIIIGYINRIDAKSGDVYVDLGSNIEGRLAKSAQIPNELYRKDDKIKCYLDEVRQGERGVDIVLSRTSPDLVKQLFELQVPEIADGQVEIFKVSRKAGYRTKLAVYTNTPEVDPVGACVGVQGARITAVMNELSGEKIDIVPYDPDPKCFIEASLAPAAVSFVRILDKSSRRAVAVVEDSQLAYAIGKSGDNVKLANKLTDWLVDIKTPSQYSSMDIVIEDKEDIERLFNTDEDDKIEESEIIDEQVEEEVVESPAEVTNESAEEEDYYFKDYPFDKAVLDKIEAKGCNSIISFFDMGIEDTASYFGFTEEENENFKNTLQEYFAFEDEE